ncbi:right-handed parallel beta-helix repeat-containing protein [Niallia alba]|uniref:right-handed parallel beta-helix repeat-containing protein n=1 Tax=Niallia alba TaxID=2729105 RepID=UPI002E2430BE|nr:right-handed parallel beta-helix repeat-containing protein [Niallia alba]
MSSFYPNVSPNYVFPRNPDQYIFLKQIKIVKYSKITLKEIPSHTHSLIVKKQDGTIMNRVDNDPSSTNQFRVDFVTGDVSFHSSMENQEIEISYTGTGQVNFGANKIIVNTSPTNEEEVTIQDILDTQEDIYTQVTDVKTTIEQNQIVKLDDFNYLKDTTYLSPKEFTWVSTANQDTFAINNGIFTEKSLIDLSIGNVPQSSDNFTLVNNTTIKLPTPLPSNIKVYVKWSEGKKVVNNSVDVTDVYSEINGTKNSIVQVNEQLATMGLDIGSLYNLGSKPQAISKSLYDRGVNIKDFGAIGDGESHPLSERYATLEEAQVDYPFATSLTQEIDSCALKIAMDNFSGLPGVVIVPRGIYIIVDVIFRSGIVITSFGKSPGYGSQNHHACFKGKQGATYILDTSSAYGGTIEGIFFNGDNRACNGLPSGGNSLNIDRCFFYQCEIAYGNFRNGYSNQANFTNTSFYNNGRGITNIYDSRVSNCTLNKNSTAIYLPTGANDNIIANNKIEWNDYRGIDAYQSNNNVFIGNIVDRQGDAGYRFTSCKYTTIIGGTFRRNGALTTNDPDKTHLHIESCEDFTIIGIVTVKDSIFDDGSGQIASKYGAYIFNSKNIIAIGCDFTGCTDTAVMEFGNTNCKLNSNIGIDDLKEALIRTKDILAMDEEYGIKVAGVSLKKSVMMSRSYFDRKGAMVNAGASASYTLNNIGVLTYDRGYRKIKLVCRGTEDYGTLVGEIPICLSREAGNASVIVGNIVNAFGTAIGSTITLTNWSCANDGSTVTFTINNTTGKQYQIYAEIID